MTVLEAKLSGRVGALGIEVELDTQGGTLVIAGPNGAGKTSLLLMLLGALEPSAGRIVVNGRELFDSALGVNVRLEERALGYVPQDYALFPHLDVLENVEFVLECRPDRANARRVRERALAVLEELDMLSLAERRAHTLSGGEKQRVALARALAAEPSALLLDEPLAALDVGARREVRAFLRAYLQKLGVPTIVVSHDAKDAAELGAHVAVLERGRISQLGTWAELRATPKTPFVEEFVLSESNAPQRERRSPTLA
jgi:molybdate transport system ATP-binding protein